MKIRISDIPHGKTVHDYPEDTVFVWDDRMPIWDLENMKRVWPDDERYEELYNNRPKINPDNNEILYPGDKGYDELL